MRARTNSGGRATEVNGAADVMSAAAIHPRSRFGVGGSQSSRRYQRFISEDEASFRASEDAKTTRCAIGAFVLACFFIALGLWLIVTADYGETEHKQLYEYNAVRPRAFAQETRARAFASLSSSRRRSNSFANSAPAVLCRRASAQFARSPSPPPPLSISAVDAWTRTHAAAFNSTSFVVHFGEPHVVNATLRDAEERSIAHSESRAARYAPAYFVADNALESAIIPSWIADGTLPEAARTIPADGGTEHVTYDASNATKELMVAVDVVVVATRADGAADRIELGEHAVLTSRTFPAGSWKPCKYQMKGHYAAGSCTTYDALKEVCVKLRRAGDVGGGNGGNGGEGEGATAPSGPWVLDETYGGHGCDPRHGWRPTTTSRVRAPNDGSAQSLAAVRAARPTRATIRSSRDPHVIAMAMTNGTMFFAEREAEMNVAAIVCLMIGVVCLVPACVLGGWTARRVARERLRAGAPLWGDPAGGGSGSGSGAGSRGGKQRVYEMV